MKTIFEDDEIKIIITAGNEIFIENKGGQHPPEKKVIVAIRTMGRKDSLTITANNCVWEPGIFNGPCGFRVSCKNG